MYCGFITLTELNFSVVNYLAFGEAAFLSFRCQMLVASFKYDTHKTYTVQCEKKKCSFNA